MLGVIIVIVLLCLISASMSKSSFSSPSELLEEAYLNSLSGVDRLKYKFLSESSKKEKIASFSMSNPKIVGKILDSVI